MDYEKEKKELEIACYEFQTAVNNSEAEQKLLKFKQRQDLLVFGQYIIKSADSSGAAKFFAIQGITETILERYTQMDLREVLEIRRQLIEYVIGNKEKTEGQFVSETICWSISVITKRSWLDISQEDRKQFIIEICSIISVGAGAIDVGEGEREGVERNGWNQKEKEARDRKTAMMIAIVVQLLEEFSTSTNLKRYKLPWEFHYKSKRLFEQEGALRMLFEASLAGLEQQILRSKDGLIKSSGEEILVCERVLNWEFTKNDVESVMSEMIIEKGAFGREGNEYGNNTEDMNNGSGGPGSRQPRNVFPVEWAGVLFQAKTLQIFLQVYYKLPRNKSGYNKVRHSAMQCLVQMCGMKVQDQIEDKAMAETVESMRLLYYASTMDMLIQMAELTVTHSDLSKEMGAEEYVGLTEMNLGFMEMITIYNQSTRKSNDAEKRYIIKYITEQCDNTANYFNSVSLLTRFGIQEMMRLVENGEEVEQSIVVEGVTNLLDSWQVIIEEADNERRYYYDYNYNQGEQQLDQKINEFWEKVVVVYTRPVYQTYISLCLKAARTGVNFQMESDEYGRSLAGLSQHQSGIGGEDDDIEDGYFVEYDYFYNQVKLVSQFARLVDSRTILQYLSEEIRKRLTGMVEFGNNKMILARELKWLIMILGQVLADDSNGSEQVMIPEEVMNCSVEQTNRYMLDIGTECENDSFVNGRGGGGGNSNGVNSAAKNRLRTVNGLATDYLALEAVKCDSLATSIIKIHKLLMIVTAKYVEIVKQIQMQMQMQMSIQETTTTTKTTTTSSSSSSSSTATATTTTATARLRLCEDLLITIYDFFGRIIPVYFVIDENEYEIVSLTVSKSGLFGNKNECISLIDDLVLQCCESIKVQGLLKRNDDGSKIDDGSTNTPVTNSIVKMLTSLTKSRRILTGLLFHSENFQQVLVKELFDMLSYTEIIPRHLTSQVVYIIGTSYKLPLEIMNSMFTVYFVNIIGNDLGASGDTQLREQQVLLALDIVEGLFKCYNPSLVWELHNVITIPFFKTILSLKDGNGILTQGVLIKLLLVIETFVKLVDFSWYYETEPEHVPEPLPGQGIQIQNSVLEFQTKDNSKSRLENHSPAYHAIQQLTACITDSITKISFACISISTSKIENINNNNINTNYPINIPKNVNQKQNLNNKQTDLERDKNESDLSFILTCTLISITHELCLNLTSTCTLLGKSTYFQNLVLSTLITLNNTAITPTVSQEQQRQLFCANLDSAGTLDPYLLMLKDIFTFVDQGYELLDPKNSSCVVYAIVLALDMPVPDIVINACQLLNILLYKLFFSNSASLNPSSFACNLRLLFSNPDDLSSSSTSCSFELVEKLLFLLLKSQFDPVILDHVGTSIILLHLSSFLNTQTSQITNPMNPNTNTSNLSNQNTNASHLVKLAYQYYSQNTNINPISANRILINFDAYISSINNLKSVNFLFSSISSANSNIGIVNDIFLEQRPVLHAFLVETRAVLLL